MADHDLHRTTPPAGWRDAFAALPLEDAPAGGWNAIARQLDARRRRPRWMLPLAAAAVLALAVVPMWLSRPGSTSKPVTVADGTGAATGAGNGESTAAITRLQAESARLEALLRYARDGRVASGTAAVMAARFDAELAAVDAALVQPGLGPEQQARLWHERVGILRASAGFESTRRWLAANGEHYDGALVRVD